MKSGIYYFCLFVFCLFTNISSFAQNNDIVQKETDIYFINGIGKSSRSMMNRDIDAINTSMSQFCPRYTGNVFLLFNQSNGEGPTGAVLDILFDVAQQKSQEVGNSVAQFVLSHFQLAKYAFGIAFDIPQDLIQRYEQKLKNDFTVAMYSENSSAKNRAFSSFLSSKITRSRSVLLVAHSQGNLYANSVHNIFLAGSNRFTKNGFHVVGVATPASSTSHNNYYTASEDRVIDLVRAAALVTPIEFPLSSNVSLSGASSIDSSGHNFTDIYMSGKLPNGVTPTSRASSRGMVVNQISFGFNQTYTPVNANGTVPVSDSTLRSPCLR